MVGSLLSAARGRSAVRLSRAGVKVVGLTLWKRGRRNEPEACLSLVGRLGCECYLEHWFNSSLAFDRGPLHSGLLPRMMFPRGPLLKSDSPPLEIEAEQG